jgi:hypothetical protein
MKIPVYYDGSRGPIRVALRGGTTALDLTEPGIRSVHEGDAEDLVGHLGGGAFSRALPLPDAAARFGQTVEELQRLAGDGLVTTHPYSPPGADEAGHHLVLDRATLKRLAQPAKEARPAKRTTTTTKARS